MINYLIKIVTYLYGYGTDFTINLANMFGLSYYETNAFIFCIAWPLITILLIGSYLLLLLTYKRMLSKKSAILRAG